MTDSPTLFTPTSASRTLPLVSRIVTDIVAMKGKWRAAVHRYELLQVAVDPAEESAEARAARDAAETLAQEIAACLDELAQVGCSMRDDGAGVVDFPSERHGREVVLSWRLGEPEVGHWHEHDADVADRRELDQEPVTPEPR